MIKTYPEMNEKIVGILRLGGQPEQYAAQYIEELKAENAALINEADENAALSMENKQRADRLEAENAALRERIDNAVKRLKDREQSVCFGWEWKGVVTDKDIDEVFGVTESSLEESEGGEE